MKKIILTAMLSGIVCAPALAANDFDDASRIFNLDDNQTIELALLSSDEMKSTEGAWVPYAIGGGIGFVTGNYSYLTSAAFNPTATWSWDSYLRTVGTSTVVGAINPVSSINSAAIALGSSYIASWQFR